MHMYMYFTCVYIYIYIYVKRVLARLVQARPLHHVDAVVLHPLRLGSWQGRWGEWSWDSASFAVPRRGDPKRENSQTKTTMRLYVESTVN